MIINYDTLKTGNCGDLLLPSVTFSNTSSNPVQMFFRRLVKNIPAGWTSCFCAPSCLPKTQDTLSFTIGTGSKFVPNTQSVAPNFGTDSIPGTGEVIVVFNEVGVNHFDTITFRGITSKLAGIRDIEIGSFLVYPNPSSETILIENLNKEIRTIQVMSMEGKPVKEFVYHAFQDKLKINISELPLGIYHLSIQFADGFVFRKIIIKT